MAVREDEALQVEDVSAMLGIGRNTVYALAKSGELASYRVGRKLRFTRTDVQRYIDASKTGGAKRVTAQAAPTSPLEAVPELQSAPDAFVISGSDIAGDVVAHALAIRNISAQRSYLNSYLSLVDMYFGRSDAAVCHLFDRKTNSYNVPYVQRLLPGMPVVVVRLARRRVGMVVAKGNPKRMHSWGSLLTRNANVANVSAGSAMRVLLDEKLGELEARPETVAGYAREATSSESAAQFVAAGAADVALVSEWQAKQTKGVEFLPMQNEWIDVVVRKTERTRPLVRAVKALSGDTRIRAELEALGFDAERLGSIVYES